ncbi:MAG: trypsin-like peptidase domain-containing protein [Planctomycetota bacterium]
MRRPLRIRPEWLATGLGVAFIIGWAVPRQFETLPAVHAGGATPDPLAAAAFNVSQAFTAASKRIAPSVVNINAAWNGGGTGVVVGDDGTIVTNFHVIGDSPRIRVELFDGRRFRAEVLGRDPETDIAVLKIDAENLEPAALGQSAKLEVGEWVLAVGNPFGSFGHTVTSGIVSATGRVDLQVGEIFYQNFIQTDAEIHPGNSGGPLVNLMGEVVGLNTAIDGRYEGIGLAIPSDMVRSVVRQIKEHGRVRRGFLGVEMRTFRRIESYTGPSRVRISSVSEEGPADRAGLETGDIVESFNGKSVRDDVELKYAIAEVLPGEAIEMIVWRDGRTRSVTVTLDERPVRGQ